MEKDEELDWDSLRLVLHEETRELTCIGEELHRLSPTDKLFLWVRRLLDSDNQQAVEERADQIKEMVRVWLQEKEWEALTPEQQILVQKLEWIEPEHEIFNGRLRHLLHDDTVDETLLFPFEEKGRYRNFESEDPRLHLLRSIIALLPSPADPMDLDQRESLINQDPPIPRSDTLRLHWIGHATMLIQVAGMNILTDPVFGFVSPCFQRKTEEGIAFDHLPAIDAVLLSHNHNDHFQESTLLRLAPQQPHILVPKGMEEWFRLTGFSSVVGQRWYTSTLVWNENGLVRFSFVPARHWSTKRLGLNRSLWGGWVIQAGGKTIYFAGDTGYDQEMFKEIARVYGPIDIALLPIAPNVEREVHMNVEDALQACRDLEARAMIPIHWGAYRTSSESLIAPLHDLQAHLTDPANYDLLDRVIILRIGEAWEEGLFD